MNKIDLKYYANLKSWPFKEAEQLLKRNGGLENFKVPKKVIFYLKQVTDLLDYHILELLVKLLEQLWLEMHLMSLVDCPTKLIAFSDDMDGLRKVPDNVPNKKMLKNIGKPLTSIPDPFEKYESFGHHNNAKLRSFLDEFKFDYEFC